VVFDAKVHHAVAEREDAGVDLCTAVDQEREDYQEDHAQDLPRRPRCEP
jgi:hypothetical protein